MMCKLRLFTLAFACLLPLCARAQDAATPPGADVAEVVFDAQPQERGLSFDRNSVHSTTVTLQGKTYDAWEAEGGVAASQPWIRSFRFKITDPKFQNGGRPATDVEITYHQDADLPLNVLADTKSGGREIGSSYGKTSDWRVLRIPLEDAFFGARDHKSGNASGVDGFDLRINGYNVPLYVRRVRLIGYDPEHNVNWSRMLRVPNLASNAPGGLLAFGRAATPQISFQLLNSAKIARALRYELQVNDYNDKSRVRQSGTLTLKADSLTPLAIKLDTRAWELGPYDGSLKLFLDAKATAPILTHNFHLGVVSNATLPKARPGEFLYGLDAANSGIFSVHTPDAFAYYKLMGVDLLRNIYEHGDPETMESVEKSLAALKLQGLQATLMAGPSSNGDAAARDRENREKAAYLEAVAKRFAGRGPGRVRFFELGNEPDLSFFYNGSMSEYALGMATLYDGIKRGARAGGAKDADTFVTNGGLSFAGPDGDRRSREFLQVVDASKLDGVAYHGHGPGIEAERSAFERARDAAKTAGKSNLPFIETESGVSGNTRAGLEEQARTVVEKMTYAQSQKLPALLFFRLFMESEGSDEGGYGLTNGRVQPRPSVLAYRNLVERLRHFAFVKRLDSDADAPGVNAYVFAEHDAKGAETGRKTVVAFSERPAQYDLALRVAASGARVQNAQVFDLYGNAQPATLLPGNLASLQVGVDATYLSWSAPGSSANVALSPPLLSLTTTPLLEGATTIVPVSLRNPSQTPLNATLSIESHARVPLTVTPTRALTLAPGKATKLSLPLALARANAPLALPTWWKVFVNADTTKLRDSDLATMPETLPGANGVVRGQFASATRNRLDIGKLAGGFGERRPAVAFAYLDAPRAMKLPAAASADWYMAWFVNGQKVYDTLESGNRHGSLADHSFDLPLRAGRNTLAVVVLSGSQGWSLDFGGPKERALAKTNLDPDRLLVTLRANGQTLSQRVVPLQLQNAVPILGDIQNADALQSWMPLQPLAVLDESAVTNFFLKEPDSSRWYKGAGDLSALTWLRDDGKNLHLFVSVRDDKNVANTATPQNGDSLRVVLCDDAGKTLSDGTIAFQGAQGGLVANGQKVTSVSRDENAEGGPQTLYHLLIPKTLVGSKPFRLSLQISDNDADYLKQTLHLGDVAAPTRGVRLIAN